MFTELGTGKPLEIYPLITQESEKQSFFDVNKAIRDNLETNVV
jgi:hypothetical protein